MELTSPNIKYELSNVPTLAEPEEIEYELVPSFTIWTEVGDNDDDNEDVDDGGDEGWANICSGSTPNTSRRPSANNIVVAMLKY